MTEDNYSVNYILENNSILQTGTNFPYMNHQNSYKCHVCFEKFWKLIGIYFYVSKN